MNVLRYDPWNGMLGYGSTAIYIFNVDTLKPTKKSPMKKILSKELCDDIALNVRHSRVYISN